MISWRFRYLEPFLVMGCDTSLHWSLGSEGVMARRVGWLEAESGDIPDRRFTSKIAITNLNRRFHTAFSFSVSVTLTYRKVVTARGGGTRERMNEDQYVAKC